MEHYKGDEVKCTKEAYEQMICMLFARKTYSTIIDILCILGLIGMTYVSYVCIAIGAFNFNLALAVYIWILFALNFIQKYSLKKEKRRLLEMADDYMEYAFPIFVYDDYFEMRNINISNKYEKYDFKKIKKIKYSSYGVLFLFERQINLQRVCREPIIYLQLNEDSNVAKKLLDDFLTPPLKVIIEKIDDSVIKK